MIDHNKKNPNNIVTLECTPLFFFTEHDEKACFSWINNISCIVAYRGIGRVLYLDIACPLSINDFLELRGLFGRYNFDNIDQLLIFKNKKNEIYFNW